MRGGGRIDLGGYYLDLKSGGLAHEAGYECCRERSVRAGIENAQCPAAVQAGYPGDKAAARDGVKNWPSLTRAGALPSAAFALARRSSVRARSASTGSIAKKTIVPDADPLAYFGRRVPRRDGGITSAWRVIRLALSRASGRAGGEAQRRVVPMGSLLSDIAVTVTANVPAARERAAVKVRTAWPPMATVRGENDAVTPAGRPLTFSATGTPYRAAGARNEMAMLVRCPARTATEDRLSRIA